jgi:hypothetical protein
MSLGTQPITSSGKGPLAPGRSGADPWPRDRVTLTEDALEANAGAGPIPRSDVRWYRPRGDAAMRHPTLHEWATGTDVTTCPRPRRHVAVEAYLRTMQS